MDNSTNVKSYTSLGEMLFSHRLKKNITIEELSAITKIHKTLIHSLESDDFINLPNKVYIYGFLRSISEALVFDVSLAFELYENHLFLETLNKDPAPPVEYEIPEKVIDFNFFKNKTSIKLKWVVAVFCVFVFALLLSPLMINFEEKTSKEEEVAGKKTPITTTTVKADRTIAEEKTLQYVGTQKVSINAKYGQSWVSFKVDKNPIRKLKLKKGSSIVLVGDKIKLTLGNYHALEVISNNEAVAITKNVKGEAVTISLPQKKIDKSKDDLVYTHDQTTTPTHPRL